MIGKNLKYYRLKNGFTMKALGEMVGVTGMAISNYESGKRIPDLNTSRALASVLKVRLADLIKADGDKLEFCHGNFRKNAALKIGDQDMIYYTIEEYLGRFFVALEAVGTVMLPAHPELQSLPVFEDDGLNARNLCDWLGIAPDSPIGNVVDLVENNGIIVCQLAIPSEHFSGLNGTVNDIPYIAVNVSMSPERQRFTILHELAHMAFVGLNDANSKEGEQRANSIAGHVLFSDKAVYRELGVKRHSISADMLVTAKEYGISMICLAYRARECGVVSESAYRHFMMMASANGWRKNEPSRIGQEKSSLFKQLVYRAIEEDGISVQRGAELLNTSYDQVASELKF